MDFTMDTDLTNKLKMGLHEITGQDQATAFLNQSGTDSARYFYQYYNSLLVGKELEKAEIAKRSGISTNYLYNILNGNRLHPGRDKIIALCIAAELTLDETQQCLKIGRQPTLYERDERDVRIAACINQGIHETLKVNLLLDDYGLPPIEV
jgi:transcriptional regulator with XRE-family HTH domain